MRRYRLVRAALIAGTILGFGSGFASLAHHRRHCHRDRDRDRPPAAAPAPPAEPAPAPPR